MIKVQPVAEEEVAMPKSRIALAFMAHPDDVEFTCAGTLALLHQQGWEIHIATMTPGQAGSEDLGPEEISKIRRCEATRSAAVLDGAYHCLECEDGFIALDRTTKTNAVALIRKVRPGVVFAPSPTDYLYDHEISSLVVRDAAFWSGVPNLKTETLPPFRPCPYLYYADPFELKDPLGDVIEPSLVVDISSVIEIKTKMLECHASQRQWLLKQHGIDEYVHAMKSMGQQRGSRIESAFGEGFRQHLGHGYPQDDLLRCELGDLVYCWSVAGSDSDHSQTA